MTQAIAPSIGRKLWFWPTSGQMASMVCKQVGQAFDATVVYVLDDRRVNLLVHDHAGNAYRFSDVPLLQGDDTPPNGQCYASWMPYQAAMARAAAINAPRELRELPVRTMTMGNPE